jgi:hypothetical protein
MQKGRRRVVVCQKGFWSFRECAGEPKMHGLRRRGFNPNLGSPLLKCRTLIGGGCGWRVTLTTCHDVDIFKGFFGTFVKLSYQLLFFFFCVPMSRASQTSNASGLSTPHPMQNASHAKSKKGSHCIMYKAQTVAKDTIQVTRLENDISLLISTPPCTFL